MCPILELFMNKRAYIQANKDWLEAKSKEDGVKALPKGIYYKVLSEGDQSSATPTVRNTLTEQETDILCAYYGLQTKRLSVKKIAEKHLLSESRVLRIVRESERKLQFLRPVGSKRAELERSDDAIEIWKYLYRR